MWKGILIGVVLLFGVILVVGCDNGDSETDTDGLLAAHAFDVKDSFEADLRFKFKQSPLADGTPGMTGTSPDGLATLELIGNVHDLDKVVLTLGLAEGAGERHAIYAILLIGKAFPDWSEAIEWMESGVASIFSGEKELVETVHGNAEIEMKRSTVLPFFFITISEG